MEALTKSIIDNMSKFQESATAQVEKGNKAAGVRARKAALEIIKQLKEFRKESVHYRSQNE